MQCGQVKVFTHTLKFLIIVLNIAYTDKMEDHINTCDEN